MEVTNQIRAKIFGLYLGCEAVQWLDKVNGVRGKLASIDKATCGLQMSDSVTQSVWPTAHSQLILTPLDKITDEDMRAVASIAFDEVPVHVWEIHRYEDHTVARHGHYWVMVKDNGKVRYSDITHRPLTILHIYDFLREAKYMLPYKGIDLYTAGIAIKP